jgi:mRNA interferase RelE/StbE
MTTRDITFTKQAARALIKMPANTARLIRAKLDLLAQDPAALTNNVTELKGSDYSRLRVGDWRVIFTIDMVVVAVIDIGPRGGIYD